MSGILGEFSSNVVSLRRLADRDRTNARDGKRRPQDTMGTRA
jgi:hypothetical protein